MILEFSSSFQRKEILVQSYILLLEPHFLFVDSFFAEAIGLISFRVGVLGEIPAAEQPLLFTSLFLISFAMGKEVECFSLDLKVIYVADSESSSIRAIDLITGGTRLLAGGDPLISENLFRFGDHDGVGSDVLLQHPLGVLCGTDGQVYIADAYNHKIKKMDPTSKKVVTVAGTGCAGFKDGSKLSAQV
ncbi:Nhl repeat-containing protein [Thalictrum thalictroides]|uniref:Nhl repeat-containing protein n=1 Tax=Thalictrum thalictroides TaxID=46969 RepID=A0A7J6V2S7_THATH|nr:Nhl repeat-containing protein [Thalictrum thalictroides]